MSQYEGLWFRCGARVRRAPLSSLCAVLGLLLQANSLNIRQLKRIWRSHVNRHWFPKGIQSIFISKIIHLKCVLLCIANAKVSFASLSHIWTLRFYWFYLKSQIGMNIQCFSDRLPSQSRSFPLRNKESEGRPTIFFATPHLLFI